LEERFPVEVHAAAWCAVVLCQARQLQQLEAGREGGDTGKVIELFPRNEP
jgi:hypothetical protein